MPTNAGKRLQAADFHRARMFLQTQARPLERALFAFTFESAGAEAVLAALTAFANTDGGFGHGLEPDMSAPVSSVICTVRALQVLREVGAPDTHPLVAGGIAYLLATYDAATGVWPIVPPAINDAPHAPWWHYAAEGQAAQWGDYLTNPRAEVLGCLHDYASLVPAELLREVTAAQLAHLHAHPPATMHDIACYLALVETPALPGDVRAELLTALTPAVLDAVEHDSARWAGYCLKPAGYMGVVSSPSSAFADVLANEVHQCLDFEVIQQGEDGAWCPTWSWGNAYPDAWPAARRSWQGILTLATLRLLAQFGRLAGA